MSEFFEGIKDVKVWGSALVAWVPALIFYFLLTSDPKKRKSK